MNRLFKNIVCVFSIGLCMCFLLKAQSPSRSDITNESIALRCLEQASLYSAASLWEDALRWAEAGLQYDEEIPDLWYMKALADSHLKKPKSEIIFAVESSLQRERWLRFNKSAARLLYANLLSDTLEWYEALSVLNEQPMIQTADADYIRAKTYYRLGNNGRAREIIKTAVNLFPADARFPLLFFKTERTKRSDPMALNLAAFLVNNIDLWQGENPEVLLLASPFITNHEERTRSIRAYHAQGGQDELYGVLALNYGIISESEAFKYIQNVSIDSTLDYHIFAEFVSLIQTREMQNLLVEWLTAFDGTFEFDTNNDGITDLVSDYERGRPAKIWYDKDQDNAYSWEALCDFGSPITVAFADKEIQYSAYPEIASVRVSTQLGDEIYNITAKSLRWSPVLLKPASLPPLMNEFFIPLPNDSVNEITNRSLLAFAGTITLPTEGALPKSSIRFSLLDGRPVSGVYTTDSQPYAYASFTDGILRFRNVDSDLDGTYDLTEFYTYDPQQYRKYATTEEQSALHASLFGSLEVASGLYISKVTADLDGNGSVDYTSTILPYNGFETKWITDSNSSWDVGFAKRPVLNDDDSFSGNYVEESFFVHPLTDEETTIVFEDGIPVLVRSNSGIRPVVKDEAYNFYWIGDSLPLLTQQVMQSLDRSVHPTVSIIENIDTDTRILAVKVGNTYFGEIY